MPPFIIPSYDFRLEGLLILNANSVCLAESLLVSHCSRAALKAKHVSEHLLQIHETEEKEKANAWGQRNFSWVFYGFRFLGKFFCSHQMHKMQQKKPQLWNKKVSLTNDISSFGTKAYICPAVKLHPNKISFSKSLLKNSHIWIVLYM